MNTNWLQHLRGRLSEPPERPRVPLALVTADRAPEVFGSIEPALAAELAAAGLPLRDAGSAWCIELPAASMIDPTFAAIAHVLRDTGRASAWRDELLDVRCDAGRRLGAIERAAVRPLGIATQAVHLVLRDMRGGVWVQQRALEKAVDPGLWDTTMGGLVAAHESIEETLGRETWEEAGLRLDQLRKIHALGRFTVRRPLPEGYMVEHIEVFGAVLPDGLTPNNRDGEVACFACLDDIALRQRIGAGDFTLEAAWILAGLQAPD